MSNLTNSVRERLADPEPEARRLATQDLPKLPAPESSDLLLVALGDEDWRVRKEAAQIASRVEPRTAVVYALAHALGERDAVGLRNSAVEALIGIGPDAVPGAIDALARLDADGRKLAVEVLAGAPTLQGMRALSKALADEDVNVVVAAVEGLGQAHLAGDEARELASIALKKSLSKGETHVRLASLEALQRLEHEVPWSVLEPLFAEPLLKRQAIAATGGSRAPRALRELAEHCADKNSTLAREATIALGRSLEEAWGDDELLEIAAKTLRTSEAAHARLRKLAAAGDDPTARGAAILALGLVRDPDDVTLLADALGDDAVAAHAEASLQLFGHEAVEPLLAAGKTAAPSLRGATLSVLPQIAPRERDSLAAVREALADPSPEVVAAALKSLSIVGAPLDLVAVAQRVSDPEPKIGGGAQAALLALTARHPAAARAMLAGTDPRGDSALASALILESLARTTSIDAADVTFLESALTHREGSVRRAAIDALAGTGEGAEAVTLALADEEMAVVFAAIRALGKLGRGEQLALLAATTRDPLRLGAVLRALRDADQERGFAAARPLLRSREPAVAAAAVEVVGSIPNEGRIEALMSATDHPDHEVVKLALAQLANTGDESAFAALARAVEHEAETVRKYAAELLGHEVIEGSESLLRARLDRERSADVRRAIMTALAVRQKGGA